MKNLILTSLSLCFLYCPVRAQSSPPATVAKTSLGCIEYDAYRKITSIAATDDKAAYEKAALISLATGACRIFRENDQIYLDEVGFWAIKVRPKGEVQSYWTSHTILPARK